MDPNTNAKTALSQFLQRHLSRAMTKADLTYTTSGRDGVFESSVTVHCMEGEVFRGVLSQSEKQAEQSAAAFALESHAADLANLPPKTTAPRKRGGQQNNRSAKPLVMGDNAKTGLIQFLQKLMGRTLTAGDTEYSVIEASGQFQATLTVYCLQSECYIGEFATEAKKAEASAAQKALDTHRGEIMALSTQVGGKPVKPAILNQIASKKLMGQARQQQRTFSPGLTFTPALALARPTKSNSVGRKKPTTTSGVPKGQAAGNHKTKLIQFMQAHVGRTLTKNDVIYTTSDQNGQFVASVTLQCLGGKQFFGGTEVDEKEAQQAAAANALDAFPAEVAAWEAQPPKAKKPRRS